ncbi:MAG: branched-chain amino acid ABC transporter ATP-binding protein [Deltaproteobacteria bacterium]|nr:MAG: branched-chain amino acid ABC transporter ATP-binding protein [Deltaproteobacteria bacterium]
MLKVTDLESGYGPMQVLWKVSLEAKGGTITALLGPNGVGKSTTLLTILGSVRPWGGTVEFKAHDVTHLPSHKKVALGLTLVPEGKHIFPSMTVHENLMMGAYPKRAQALMEESRQLVYSLFPVLEARSNQQAGTLSGGEQQMLTIGRALMSRPELLMLDEPSQGLAPKLVGEVFDTIEKIRSEMGVTILLVEQNVDISLEVSKYVYVMHEGTIKAEGPAEKIKSSEDIRKAYLGL